MNGTDLVRELAALVAELEAVAESLRASAAALAAAGRRGGDGAAPADVDRARGALETA